MVWVGSGGVLRVWRCEIASDLRVQEERSDKDCGINDKDGRENGWNEGQYEN